MEVIQKLMKNKIKIGDFKITEEEKKAIMEICEIGRVTEYKKTNEFEKKWAEKIGTKYCIALNSGTSALIAGLYALKHLSNDKRKKVITSPVTYIATSNAIRLSGLEPIYADINPKTFDILPKGIEKILSENNPEEFLAILPVHLMGYPCDMIEINRIAKKNNLFVFEDAAQAHGTKYNGRTLGSFGDLADFSFYIAHNIQAGELGAITTNSLEIRNLVRRIKSNGRSCDCDICTRARGICPKRNNKSEEDFDPRFTHDILGFNFKANEFSTALASIRTAEMGSINERRREIIQYLNQELEKFSEFLQLPEYSDKVSYLGYPLILKKGSRKEVREKLEKKGIETRILFGCIPLQQPSFSDLKSKYEGKLPNAEYIGKKGFYIGCHQYLTKENLDYVINCFEEIFRKNIP
jgi:dTDP-4-amino-4,6-dideoxygalactose transaminase